MRREGKRKGAMNNPGLARRFQQSKSEGGNFEATNHFGVRFTKANR